MARKKPAKKAKKKSAAKPAARKAAKKSMKKAAKKASRPAAKKKAPKPARRAAPRKAAPKKAKPKKQAPVRKAAPAAKAKPKGRLMNAVKTLAKAAVVAGVSAALGPASAKATADKPKKKPNLDRPRKTVADVHGIPSSLDLDRSPSAARSGRAELNDKLAKSTTGGAAITAGDVDADWQSAEAVGDEAPGGDNPTPDQDVVDDIGRALGVEYADDEELQGGAEIAERDLNRWELDPASKDDFEEDED